ncbi:MAG: hypothetical protein AVDCRST_MAG18-922 [uncultured Thermomicrobiales bacterium]|uniref:Uncharacterized protein n=1 Tax=uncultured Thermomicrobiales bacterium TaxID=1645740 RepID=A0A6J4UTT7_9BACT|nr:MAG: hypothetical protein AVDCRST_MAG18-922 [uncultured Thermomicrobiales bacterium]
MGALTEERQDLARLSERDIARDQFIEVIESCSTLGEIKC